MKTENHFSKLKESEIGQEPIAPLNSKYTYAHLSHFHHTILTILGNKDLSRLPISDLKNIAYFTNLIIHLLELPHMAYQTQEEKNNFSYKKPPQIGRSNKCLRALLKWIAHLKERKYITLETVLDEYYNKFPYAQKIIEPDLTQTIESSGKTYISQ